ncbi:MAG TPA: acylphosphatase [Thermoguttaceae bacterium]|nr:acylphosphatase [Thermoguttaceae bacterium]HPP53023.1 acylphosphatase [Thermoguttaceae bacterium]
MGELEPQPHLPERWEIYYEGHVQGVGFRYTTRRIAAQFAVTGYVRNLPDGRVQVVLEGLPEEMDRMLQAIQSVMGRHIGRITRKRTAATGEFQGFEIRF